MNAPFEIRDVRKTQHGASCRVFVDGHPVGAIRLVRGPSLSDTFEIRYDVATRSMRNIAAITRAVGPFGLEVRDHLVSIIDPLSRPALRAVVGEA